MRSTIVVHPNFDGTWPFAADHLRELWQRGGDVEFIRLPHGDTRPVGEILERPGQVTRLALLAVPLTESCARSLTALSEVGLLQTRLDSGVKDALAARSVSIYSTRSEGFWGQSVSEYGLALTLCGLRRIPQDHHA
ncbi:MAG TPA: hydroxyacid dehydrogenase, partial [Planctomycetota bacterium]|nr:hydroxyacid dehydrogenase [Planctomycetota bacterium]